MTSWNATNELSEVTGFAVAYDRRRNPRTSPVGHGTALWIENDNHIPVQIVDESEHGVGVVIPTETSFEIGPVVFLDYQGKRRAAFVAHLTRRDNHSFRLGLAWR